MDNQHRKITGYRELTEEEIERMNRIKRVAEDVGRLTSDLRNLGDAIDQRWVSIGVTDLQKGFMALTRAIAQPESF